MNLSILNHHKKILVTGGTGFLGRFFVRLLLQKGYLPILIVRPSGSLSPIQRIEEQFTSDEMERITIWEGDLTEMRPESIPDSWKDEGSIVAMFHIAGLVKFDHALREELYRVNFTGTKNAITLAQTLSIPKFYYVSTAYTAGSKAFAKEQIHSKENSFHNPYEESKCFAEHVVMNACTPRFKTKILRPSIIIGDSKTGEADTQFSIYGFLRGLSLFKRKAEKYLTLDKGKAYFPLRIEGDPHGLSNIVPVNYVAEVMLTALEQECEHQIFHLTNPVAPTKQMLLDVFSELLQVKGMALVKRLDKMSTWDKRFATFISVYKPYMQDDPAFCTKNTRSLMEESKKEVLELQKEDYLRIFKPALCSEAKKALNAVQG